MIDDLLNSLENVQFRELNAESLSGIWPAIVEIVRNPSSNVPAAILILLIVTILFFMLGSAIMLAFLGGDDEDEEYEEYEVVEAASGERAVAVASAPRQVVLDPLRHYKRILIAAGVVLLLLLATGTSTQADSVCRGCHRGQPHFEAAKDDAHASVSCVDCHEGHSTVGGLTIAVPARAAHVVTALADKDSATSFAPISSRGCRRCHPNVNEGVLELPDRGLRVSHKEPLEAGATCLDCHRLDGNEKVSHVTEGMSTCLRCHDNETTKGECETCHTADVSRAVVARHTQSTNNARELVSEPDCYSCHSPKTCDSCHGVRLPHPRDYAASHMRDAAADIWYNGGKRCAGCHTESRRSCARAGCHDFSFEAHGAEYGEAHKREPVGTCDQCHNQHKLFDNGCLMCHTKAEID